MSSQQAGPRLILNSDNKSALIVIVTAIGLSWTLLTLIIRVVSKLHVKRSIGLEEVLVVAASVIAGISSACILVGISCGLGRRDENVSNEDNDTLLKLLWLSDIFYPITLSIAKGAALPLLTQLTRIRTFIVACYTLAVFTGLWGFLSILMIAARCHLGSPWIDTSAQKCPSLYPRWVAIETVSLLIEILIFGIFVSIIHILKMRFSVKVKVLIAFSTRLPIIVPIVFRLIYLRRALTTDGDPSFALTNAIIATQVVLHYTTMAASFAYLKPFLRAFDSNLCATVKVDTVVSSGYVQENWTEHARSRSEDNERRRTISYPLQQLQQSHRTQPETPENKTVDVTPQTHQLTRSPTQSSKLDQKPTLSLTLHDQPRVQRRKRTSRESITPMITKTQEWHVATETRDCDEEKVRSQMQSSTIHSLK